MKPALFCAAPLLALSAQTAAPLAADSNPPPADSIAIADADQRMTVPVQIADAGPFHFVVDTGAERTVISRELATTLGLAAGRGVRVTAMANVEQVATVVIPRIRVGPPASTLSGSLIEAPAFAASNIGGAGMLGIDTLQGHAVTIDFDRNVMTVTPSAKRRHTPDAAPGEVVVRARDMFGQLVVTDAYFGERRVRVVIDTGSDVTMGNPALRRLIGRRTTLRPISARAVTGVALLADYGQIGAVRIGSTTIDNLPVAFADAPPFARFGLGNKPALMLGMDALRLFRRVTIDFPNRELRLLLPRDVKTVPLGGLARA
ncbi:aspartyl protease family protein [Sphingomonas sp. NFR15]|uniref:aspartyl protease family protein n=1 Tax=Sphingomonas sp. NFR15 TaxID=1566282 RepID=UPI00088FBE38|nr:aspartyl protease family protein [Sphingomonas sp. NFR15]SDA26517.1 Aspartyl protease [Sphingomonas sp. NFR15]